MWWRKSSGPYCEWELQFKEAIHFSTCVSKMMQVLFCVRPAAHVSNRCKSGIRPVVGRI